MEYKCNTCNKTYKTYQTLWKHNKTFHTNFNLKSLKNTSSCLNNSSKNLKNNHTIEYNCLYCNKLFNRKDNQKRHEKICKEKDNNQKNIKQLELQLQLKEQELQQKEEQFKNAIIEIKKEFIDLIKNNNINPDNLKQINNKVQKVNNKYGTNNVNNGQIINNTYVKFGNLDYTKIFSEKEICKLMNTYKYKCIEELIKKVHFNDKHPEYGNIFITNLRDNVAYIFDGNEFIASDKTDTIIDLIDNHANEINLTLDNHRAKLNEYTITKIEDLLHKLESEDKFIDENNKSYSTYKVYKMNVVKKDIYNLSDRKKLELLQNMKLYEQIDEDIDSEKSITI